jgi:hypothetical protein
MVSVFLPNAGPGAEWVSRPLPRLLPGEALWLHKELSRESEMIPVHYYLISQIAAARQADLTADAANRRLVREARSARRTREATAAGRPAHRTGPLRLALWHRPRLAS